VLAPPLDRTVYLHAPRLLLDLGLQGLGGRGSDGAANRLGSHGRARDDLRHGADRLLSGAGTEHHAGPRGGGAGGGCGLARVVTERQCAHGREERRGRHLG
jgi:hypothetical protein